MAAGLIYLLDTNILSEPAKPEPNESVMALFKKHRKSICTDVLIEGANRSCTRGVSIQAAGHLDLTRTGKVVDRISRALIIGFPVKLDTSLINII